MGNLLSPAGTPRQTMQLVTDMLTTRSVSAAIFTEVHDALGSEATVALLTVINRSWSSTGGPGWLSCSMPWMSTSTTGGRSAIIVQRYRTAGISVVTPQPCEGRAKEVKAQRRIRSESGLFGDAIHSEPGGLQQPACPVHPYPGE